MAAPAPAPPVVVLDEQDVAAADARLLHALAHRATAGLARCAPRLIGSVSTGGSYLLRDARGAPLAVLKPEDEEAFAPNNPRGFDAGGAAAAAVAASQQFESA